MWMEVHIYEWKLMWNYMKLMWMEVHIYSVRAKSKACDIWVKIFYDNTKKTIERLSAREGS